MNMKICHLACAVVAFGYLVLGRSSREVANWSGYNSFGVINKYFN